MGNVEAGIIEGGQYTESIFCYRDYGWIIFILFSSLFSVFQALYNVCVCVPVLTRGGGRDVY